MGYRFREILKSLGYKFRNNLGKGSRDLDSVILDNLECLLQERVRS